MMKTNIVAVIVLGIMLLGLQAGAKTRPRRRRHRQRCRPVRTWPSTWAMA